MNKDDFQNEIPIKLLTQDKLENYKVLDASILFDSPAVKWCVELFFDKYTEIEPVLAI